MNIVHKWVLVDNSDENFEFIAEGSGSGRVIKNKGKWLKLNEQYNEGGRRTKRS